MCVYPCELLITLPLGRVRRACAPHNAYFCVTAMHFALVYRHLQPHKFLPENMRLRYANVHIHISARFTFDYLSLQTGAVLYFVNSAFSICKCKFLKSVWEYKCVNLLNVYFGGISEAYFCQNPVLPHRRQKEGIYAILSEWKSMLSC